MKKIFLLMLIFVYVTDAKTCRFLGDELIKNGSFDNGFNEFYTKYLFINSPPMANTGQCTVTDKPSSYFSGWQTFPDKSTSNNNYMFLADASINPNLVLIGTNVSVLKNKNYIFSLWVAKVNNAGQTDINVMINKQQQIFSQINENAGIWVNLTFEWISHENENANIEIFNPSPDQYGNDFVIDEISLKECSNFKPKITNSVYSPICVGDDIYLSTDSIADAFYYWSGPDGFNSNNRNVVIKNAQLKNSGKYYLYVVLDGIASDTLVVDVLVNQFVVSPNDNTLGFKGSTERHENYIKLTNSREYDFGAVWLKEKYSFTHDFETTFEFNVTKGDNGGGGEGSIPGADGIAFVIQNRDNPVLGKKGGDIGYSGFPNSLAVEIDLFQNVYDPNGNHIAVQSMGYESNVPDHNNKKALLGINDKILTILQDSIYYVKIQYEWKNKRLRVFIDSTPNLLIPQLEVYNLNIVNLIGLENGEYGYIGLTSATGGAFQEHNIYNWIVPCKNNTVDVDDNFSTEKYNLSVNPNPVEGFMNIHLNLPNSEFANLVLFDLNGRVVKTILNSNNYSLVNQDLSIDISELTVGMYFLKLQTSKFIDFQKILIIK